MRIKNWWTYADYGISVLIGLSMAYFLSSLIGIFFIPKPVLKLTEINRSGKNRDDKKKLILMANIFQANTGEKISQKIDKKNIPIAKVVSDIEGYKVVGYVKGDNPMVLLKKKGKPVEIITKNKGLNNLWFLDRIENRGVFLINKKTKKIKLFRLKGIKKNLQSSGVIKNSVGMKNSSRITKIVVNRSMLDQASNINNLLKEINVGPVFNKGQAIGYRINYLSNNSIIKKIGLKKGDIIISINGEPTTDPNAIITLYSELKDLTGVSIDLIRNNKKKTIFVEIQ